MAVEREVIGWREWLSLPEFEIRKLKVKVDTGAKTSALHATNVKLETHGGKKYVSFRVHLDQHHSHPWVGCRGRLVDFRKVRSSSGHVTARPVIVTTIALGKVEWEAEFTLVNRDMMGFRVLLGRSAIRNRFLVHAGRSFLTSKKKKKKIKTKKKVQALEEE